MDIFDKSVETALSRYFTHLSQFGYMNEGSVNKLILLTFLRDFLEEYIVTEEDYQTISRVLKCLEQSSCLIPYTSYIKAQEAIGNSYLYNQPVRITQDDIIRQSQDQEIRIVNQ